MSAVEVDCPRCGGCIEERQEDTRCLICGNRTFPGHVYASLSTEPTDEQIRERRHALVLSKYKRTKGIQRKDTPRAKFLRKQPNDCAIDEHPYMIWLGEVWDKAEARIEVEKKLQKELKEAADLFLETYPKPIDTDP